MQQLVHCDHIICTICAISIAIYPALIDCMPLHCTHIAGVCCGGGRDGTHCVSAFLLLLVFFQLLVFLFVCFVVVGVLLSFFVLFSSFFLGGRGAYSPSKNTMESCVLLWSHSLQCNMGIVCL